MKGKELLEKYDSQTILSANSMCDTGHDNGHDNSGSSDSGYHNDSHDNTPG